MPKGQRLPDMTGEKFGMLTLREKTITKHKHVTWECECDCGKRVRRRQDYLLEKGRQHNASCGCNHPHRINIGKDSFAWKGCGEVSGHYFGMIRWRCNRYDLPFDLTIEYLWELFQRQGGKCALTGRRLTLMKSSRRPWDASLDRIDSSKGYTKDNVWWLHKDVNRMKMDTPLHEFVDTCHLIASRWPTSDANSVR